MQKIKIFSNLLRLFAYVHCLFHIQTIRIYHEYEGGGDRKSVPRITDFHHSASLVMPIGDPRDGFFYPTLRLMIDSDWHHEACRVMTISDPRDGFFYPILTQLMDSFSCSPLNTSFVLEKLEKDFQKILNMWRCDMVTSF